MYNMCIAVVMMMIMSTTLSLFKKCYCSFILTELQTQLRLPKVFLREFVGNR